MNVYIYTLGCRLNQCESEAIADSFAKNGFSVLQSHEDADIVVVNSCTVTSKAEQKARRMIRLFSERAKVVIATGCYAEVNREEVEGLGDNIDIFSTTFRYREIYLNSLSKILLFWIHTIIFIIVNIIVREE